MVKGLIIWEPATNPWSKRSPGEGNGYPLQYPCLDNPWKEKPRELQSLVSHTVRIDISEGYDVLSSQIKKDTKKLIHNTERV